MAEGGNGSVYSAAQVLDLLEETDCEDMEMDESDDLNEPVCDGSEDDLGIDMDSEDEER